MTKRHAGGILVAALLLAFAFFAQKAFAAESRIVGGEVNVIAGVTPVLRITLPEDITIRIDPGSKDPYTVPIQLDIYTNNPDGYDSFMSTSRNRSSAEDTAATALIHKQDSQYKIDSLTEATTFDTFPAGYWGYSIDGAKTFTGMPAANDSALADTDTNEGMYFGVKVPDFQPSGTYAITLVVSAVTRHVLTQDELFDGIEYMQDMTTAICETENAGSSKQLIDRRDGKTYWVTKMRDNNCWMTQNLDFELSKNGTTLTPNDSNVFRTKTIRVADERNDNAILYMDLGDYYIPDGDRYDENGNPYSTVELDATSKEWHYHMGSLYSYTAATAGSGDETIYIGDADESICPKGWRLPIAGGVIKNKRTYSFNKLFHMQPETVIGDYSYYDAYTISAVGAAPFYFVNTHGLSSEMRNSYTISGEEKSVMPYMESSSTNYLARYWTSSASILKAMSGDGGEFHNETSNTASAFTIENRSSANSADDFYAVLGGSYDMGFVTRYMGNYVRCVAVKNDLYSISTMQEITPEIVKNTDVDASKMLTDTRDGKKYWVTKEYDGNIWMTENLDFEISDSGTQLTPNDSDVLATKTITKEGNYGSSLDGIYSLDEGVTFYSDMGATSTHVLSTLDNTQSYKAHFASGDFYSWNAATAGSGAAAVVNGEEAAESICPKGWRLPSNGVDSFGENSYNNMVNKFLLMADPKYSDNREFELSYYGKSGLITFPPLYFHFTGTINDSGGLVDDDLVAAYWSSSLKLRNQTDGAYAYQLRLTSKDRYTFFDRADQSDRTNRGAKVRCVAKNTESYTVIYDANGGVGEPNMQYGYTDTRERTVTLSMVEPAREGFTFVGWSRDPNATIAEYQAGDTITFSQSSITLYAVWGTTLQSFKCSSLKSVGSVIGAIDVRDGKNYTVKKLEDGKCWTIENLRLDLSDLDEDISAENTNNPTREFMNAVNATPRPGSSNSWCTTYGSNECYNQIQYNTINLGDFNNAGSGSDGNPFDSYGVYYNWYTAVAGNEVYDETLPSTSYDNGAIAGDLCPYGWHIPSKQEYSKLNSLYNSSSTRKNTIMNSGSYSGTSPSARGYSTFYWTVGGSVSYGLATWNGNSSWPWYYGSTIKCVANTEDLFHISYSANGGSNIPTDSVAIKSTNGRAVFTISDRIPTRENYTFEGWATSPDATTATYQPGQVVSLFEPVTNLYAVWVTAFQNFDCSQLTFVGDSAVVKDSRDGNNYTVAKLADGQCWMTESLRLSLYTLKEDISSANTNNPTVSFMNAANARPMWTSNFCSSNSNECVDSLAWNFSNNQYYYNWYAATAGNGTSAMTSGHAEGDICPAGWHLPTGAGFGEFGTLSKALGGLYNSYTGEALTMSDSTTPTGAELSEAFQSSPNNFALTGYWMFSSTYGRTTHGYYWSSTANSDNYAYNVDMNATYIAPGTTSVPRYYGYTVRCVADYQRDYTVSFNANGGADVPGAQIVRSGKGKAKVTIPNTIPTRQGFTFRGWSTQKYVSSPEYQPGDEVLLMAASPSTTLYAIWESSISLQNFNCSSSLPNIGDTIVARDTRDNQYYGVIKLADGNCWFAEDLRLNFNSLQESISADNTNNPSSTFITQVNAGATSTWNARDWCTDENSTCYDQIQYRMHTSSYSKKLAGFYNWYTATAGTRLYSAGGGNASGDICPYGWHLPTGNSNGEFGKLSNALGGLQSNGEPQFMDSSTNPTGEAMNAILRANSFYNNTYHYGSTQYINMSAYWSSTAYNSDRSRALFINLDRVAPGIYYANNKNYGFAIRCLKN